MSPGSVTHMDILFLAQVNQYKQGRSQMLSQAQRGAAGWQQKRHKGTFHYEGTDQNALFLARQKKIKTLLAYNRRHQEHHAKVP